MCLERQTGFSIIAAIFLVVVLALLAAFIASVTGMQQSSGQLDVLGVRAYQSARAGMEWSAWQIIDPGNTLNPGPTCAAAVMPTCFASPQNLPPLAGSLSGFTVTVTCAQTANTPEARGAALAGRHLARRPADGRARGHDARRPRACADRFPQLKLRVHRRRRRHAGGAHVALLGFRQLATGPDPLLRCQHQRPVRS